MTEPLRSTPCPSCGVAVPLGYPKCPRCHAAMPSTGRIRRESMREQLAAGGTAVAAGEGGGFPWLLAGVAAAAAIIAIIWYVERGPARDAPTAAPIAGSAAVVIAPAPGAAAASGTTDVEPPAPPRVDPRPFQRAQVIAALEHALQSDQLWAQVSDLGDAIVIRSAFCADKGVGVRVDAAHDALAGLGYKHVRCVEQGGSPVWARDL